MKIIKTEAEFTMFDWWKKAVTENYSNFDGRSRRSEYWYFRLVSFLFMMIPGALIIAGAAINSETGGELGIISILGFSALLLFGLFLIIPSLAVSVRRLHDTGKSGWYLLLGIIPIVSYVGGIILLVFYCTDSERGRNKWGPNPKAPSDDFDTF